ncbi:MAG: hypothetical protein U1F42_02365 [Candidatus Competibacteraceae bacterium]
MPFTAWFRASGSHSWLTSGLLLAAPLLLGASSDYLREIEEEAKRQAATLTTSQTPPASDSSLTSGDAQTERLPPGLDQAKFEQALHDGFIGTYAFYQRLDDANKRQVYELYQKDNRLSSISALVTRLLTGNSP